MNESHCITTRENGEGSQENLVAGAAASVAGPTCAQSTETLAEEWRSIVGYEGLYEVSNFGRIRSLDRMVGHRHGQSFHKGEILKIGISGCGYWRAVLTKNRKSKILLVHRLVALAFIPNPENKPQINHIDGVKLNSHVNNLEWNTSSENCSHAYRIKLRLPICGENNVRSKLNAETVLQVRKLKSEGMSYGKIANLLNMPRGTAKSVGRGESWKHLP